jgi:hypothetical protein
MRQHQAGDFEVGQVRLALAQTAAQQICSETMGVERTCKFSERASA